MIYILDRNEKIKGVLKNDIDISNENVYFDDLYIEDLETGTDTFEFSTITNKEISDFLVVGNYIAFNKNNYLRLLQITETEEEKTESLIKNVYCETVGLELSNSIYNGGSMNDVNIERFLNNILQDTNWKVGYVDSSLTTSLSLNIESKKEVYSLIQEHIKSFGGEIQFRTEIKNNTISGRYIDVYSKRGKIEPKRLEINRNINSISRKINIANYATKLIGIGKDNIDFKDIVINGIDKPLGQDFIINKEAFETINNKGNHITKIYEYDTNDPYELLRQTKKALDQLSKPQVIYEVDASILDFENIEIGDKLLISDMSFNPPLMVEARIGYLETSKSNKNNNKATLTNFKELKSYINNFKMSGRQIIKAINDSYSEIKLDGKCIEEKTISGDKIIGGVIEGTELKTSEPHSNGGMWIRDNGMQLGQTAFIYDPSGRFAISSKDDMVISNGSGKNIYLMPSEYVSINGDCTAKSFKLGSGTDAFFSHGTWYSQFANGNLETYGIKLNFLNLIGTASGNLHVTNGNGSSGGIYGTFMNSYNITTECDIDYDNTYSALELINNAIVKQNKIIPKTTTFSDNKLEDYLKITENEIIETNINNIIPLLWKSIQELTKEINILKGVDTIE